MCLRACKHLASAQLVIVRPDKEALRLILIYPGWCLGVICTLSVLITSEERRLADSRNASVAFAPIAEMS